MRLSTEQIKIAKSIVFYAIGVIVIVPIFRFLFGKPFIWSDILISSGGILAGSIIVGLLLIFYPHKESPLNMIFLYRYIIVLRLVCQSTKGYKKRRHIERLFFADYLLAFST